MKLRSAEHWTKRNLVNISTIVFLLLLHIQHVHKMQPSHCVISFTFTPVTNFTTLCRVKSQSFMHMQNHKQTSHTDSTYAHFVKVANIANILLPHPYTIIFLLWMVGWHCKILLCTTQTQAHSIDGGLRSETNYAVW